MASSTPPSLTEAVQASKESWQRDLQSLFDHAKDRFADVVWELVGETESSSEQLEEVWGHKAMIYARAPPSFQARYFSFRPAPVASPTPYYSPHGQSALSLSGELRSYSPARSPSPYGTLRTQSPISSTSGGQVLRLTTTIASALFSNELEYLYTGKGFGEAFEFLFETNESKPEGDAEVQRVDKLRKDLVFMWRSRLYSDVRISITGLFSSSSIPDGETASAQFSSHRFILASRSPYFRSLLLGGFAQPATDPGQTLTLTLPSPPFTPASLHFILGYIYTGTVAFSNRTFDLETAFHILRSATYLSLTALYNEIQARLVQEMMHGLFHAFLDFAAYENVTGGKWGAGGCGCRSCFRRAPRVLEFATGEDIKNIYLERGARRAIVGHFGEGWCSPEFAALPQKMRESMINGVSKRAVPINIIPLIIAGHHGLAKLDRIQGTPSESWASISRECVLAGLKRIADALCLNAAECFEQSEWLEILEADGDRFEDVEHVEWVMDAVRTGLAEKNGGIMYQVLVSSILIRPHPTESGDTLLSAQSRVRSHVEKAREDIIRWLRRRWMGVRQESGFNELESWALKEISHEIEVPAEDLLNRSSSVDSEVPKTIERPNHRGREAVEDETSSVTSLRASVLNRNMAKANTGAPSLVMGHTTSTSSAGSLRSTSTNTSSASRSGLPRSTGRGSSHGASRGAASAEAQPKVSTSSTRSLRSPSMITLTRPQAHKEKDPLITPRASMTSVRSGLARSVMSATSKSDATSTFKTAKSEVSSSSLAVPRGRRASTVSTHSTISAKSSISPTPSKVARSLKGSNTPVVVATLSTAPDRVRKTSSKGSIVGSIPSRPKSTASLRSIQSSASARTTKAHSLEVPPPVPEKDVMGSKSASPPNHTVASSADESNQARSDLSERESIPGPSESDRASTVKANAISRKGSHDTITGLKPIPRQSQIIDQALAPMAPRGAILNVGIPCIVSSKRSRFRAFARYIGEVEGEIGPWVGVEVPVSDNWSGDKLDGRQWNDGSWGGIRYFEINPGSEWDEGEERASRRRRLDQIHSILTKDSKGTKREGEHLALERTKRMRSVSPAVSDMSVSDTRGLFVRPQQILYVVDAVGSDL